MKKYYIEQNGSTVISDHPISINSEESKIIDITDEDFKKINNPNLFYLIKNGKLEFIEKPKKPKQIVYENLKARFETGTATNEDVMNALKLLL